MKHLKQFLRTHWGSAVLNVLLVIAQAVGTLLLPLLLAEIVDRGILAGDMGAVYRIGGWMLLVTVLATAVAIGSSYSAASLGAAFGREMRERLIRRSQELSLRQFEALGLPSMITRATADITAMQTSISMFIQMILPAPLLVLAAVIMTVRASGKLALVLLVSLAALLLFCLWMVRAAAPLSEVMQKKLDRINLVVREHITGTRVIRAFGREAHEERRSDEAFSDYARTMIRLGRMFAVVNPAVWLMLGLCMAAILWVGGTLAGHGAIALGQITAVSEYATMALSYLIMAAAYAVSLPKLRACLDRLSEVLDIVPDLTDGAAAEDGGSADAPVLSMEQVDFAYPGAEAEVLRGLNFVCRRGETTAIIGGTGSGKSTVAELLLRLHDVSGGTIRLHGQDIRSMPQEALRAAIGCVPQKAFLFSGTIRDNLRMGNEHASDEALWAALKVAQADAFVSALPQKLDAPVAQGGGNFSGGQRQRLSIARALVRKADLYLFDDSFSALDVKTDAALRRALAGYGADAVKLIIAQRVSTILDADQILVLDEGRMVGKGTHGELMQSCPVYRDIVRSQMEQKGA